MLAMHCTRTACAILAGVVALARNRCASGSYSYHTQRLAEPSTGAPHQRGRL